MSVMAVTAGTRAMATAAAISVTAAVVTAIADGNFRDAFEVEFQMDVQRVQYGQQNLQIEFEIDVRRVRNRGMQLEPDVT